MFTAYILYSKTLNRYYIGHTANLEDRVARHLQKRSGFTKFTKRVGDWIIVYSEKLPTRTEAIKRERYLKQRKDRKFIEKLIAGWRSSTSGVS